MSSHLQLKPTAAIVNVTEQTEDDQVLSFDSSSSSFMGYEQGYFGNKSKICARGHWRPAEDAMLVDLVSLHGPQNWNLIAQNLQGRSGKSCRLRWFNQLDPRIKKNPFSYEEEERLLAAQQAYGNKWALISRLFPGRTDNAVKNHWHVIMARRNRSVYRRRKPSTNNSCSPCLFTGKNNVEVNDANNHALNVRDESMSTCTELSLNSNNSGGVLFLNSPGSQFHQKAGFEEKVALMNGCHVGAPMRLVSGTQQYSGYSDSKSDASAPPAEAVLSYINYEREKTSYPFIDFLGVGAT